MQITGINQPCRLYQNPLTKALSENNHSGKEEAEADGNISVTISDEAKKRWQETEEESSVKEKNKDSVLTGYRAAQNAFYDEFKDQIEQVRKEAQSSGEEAKKIAKCLKIAMEIAAGNVVPEQDQEYLRKNNPDLFAKAMEMRIPKEEPEECESVLEDGDMDNGRETGYHPKGMLYQNAGELTSVSGSISVSIS